MVEIGWSDGGGGNDTGGSGGVTLSCDHRWRGPSDFIRWWVMTP